MWKNYRGSTQLTIHPLCTEMGLQRTMQMSREDNKWVDASFEPNVNVGVCHAIEVRSTGPDGTQFSKIGSTSMTRTACVKRPLNLISSALRYQTFRLQDGTPLIVAKHEMAAWVVPLEMCQVVEETFHSSEDAKQCSIRGAASSASGMGPDAISAHTHSDNQYSEETGT